MIRLCERFEPCYSAVEGYLFFLRFLMLQCGEGLPQFSQVPVWHEELCQCKDHWGIDAKTKRFYFFVQSRVYSSPKTRF